MDWAVRYLVDGMLPRSFWAASTNDGEGKAAYAFVFQHWAWGTGKAENECIISRSCLRFLPLFFLLVFRGHSA